MEQRQDSEREQADAPHPLTLFLEPESLELLAGTGADFIEQIGLDVIRDIILDVLTGKDHHREIYGELSGTLHLDSGAEAHIDWLFMAYLLNTVGSQTLTIRGSDKSLIGKLFEKLILGSLLSILDFQHVAPYHIGKGVFWLSSQDEKRESDATLLYDIGQGVRFDIGFIGRGNPEISLDKVARFERETSIHGNPFYMATIILVDRIGKNSRIERMAEAIDGSIVQMSATYWPQRVAEILRNTLGFEHELADMNQNAIEDYLRDKLKTIPIENFLKNVRIVGSSELEPSADENDAVEDDQSSE